jgi:hypothetical protein
MNTLEIIHLRLAGNDPGALVDMIHQSVGSGVDSVVVRIYRNAKLETDLAVHLHRQVTEWDGRASDVGTRLTALLREYGMVEHSVWVEACGTAEREAD